jgi:hypothetical protein
MAFLNPFPFHYQNAEKKRQTLQYVDYACLHPIIWSDIYIFVLMFKFYMNASITDKHSIESDYIVLTDCTK